MDHITSFVIALLLAAPPAARPAELPAPPVKVQADKAPPAAPGMDQVLTFLIALVGALPPTIVALTALLVAIRNARAAIIAVAAAEGAAHDAKDEAISTKIAAVAAVADAKVAIAENTAITQQVQEQTNGAREEAARLLAEANLKIDALKHDLWIIKAQQSAGGPPSRPQARGT